ncbi:hypothetical protein GLYMA_06G252433v4 [Glycine max]|nr:hypothetical protein GLYMA_06G252433v4 [Glycine max]KAH1127545.1 hypothetical protein GYH30_016232 [Glycine max]
MSRCILSHVLAFALVSALSVFSCLVNVAQAQSANTTTDPSEGIKASSEFNKECC